MKKLTRKIISILLLSIILCSVFVVNVSASVMPGYVYRRLSPVHYYNGTASTVLNIATNGSPAQNTNVNLWATTGHTTQSWIFKQVGGDGYWRLCSRSNESYALNVWRGSNNYFNCDIHTYADNLKDSAVASLNLGQYLIQLDLQNYPGYCLNTGLSSGWPSNTNVKWLNSSAHTWAAFA